jgi:transcriptional regulator with XRE-family HTH domain
LTYQDAQAKLLAYVRDRIHNGEFTERGLARLIGISQPHVHNVLKGVRNLSAEILDSMLDHFQISLLDLAAVEELEANLERRRVRERTAEAPILSGPIGPGARWPAGIDRRRRFPLPFSALAAPPELVIARLSDDPEMHGVVGGADLALLDVSVGRRGDLAPEGVFVVDVGGEALLRYVRPGTHRNYLATAENLNIPLRWRELRLTPAELREVVKARVRWLGRERDRNLPLAQRGGFLYDPISR